MAYSTDYIADDLTNKYGVSDAIEYAPSSRYDDRAGWTVSRRFRGTYSAIKSLSDSFVVTKTPHDINPESPDGGGYYILTTSGVATANDGKTQPDADTVIAVKYEVDTNEINTPLWNHPNVKTWTGDMYNFVTGSISQIEYEERLRKVSWVKQAVEKAVKGEYSMPHWFYMSGSNPTSNGYNTSSMDISMTQIFEVAEAWGANTASLKETVRILQNGVESYLDKPQYVLRIDRICSLNTNLRPSTTYINRLFTPAALYSYETVPASIQSTLPTSGYWLKKSPTVMQSSADKLTIHAEYWHGENYEMFLYGAPVT